MLKIKKVVLITLLLIGILEARETAEQVVKRLMGNETMEEFRERIHNDFESVSKAESISVKKNEDVWQAVVREWGFENKYEAKTYLYNTNGNEMFIQAQIEHSLAGQKSLYINIWYAQNPPICTIDASYKDIVYFDNQAIKMDILCKKGNPNNYFEYRFTTDKGLNYVVSLLKKAKKDVYFKSDIVETELSSKGFTREWSSFGTDAL